MNIYLQLLFAALSFGGMAIFRRYWIINPVFLFIFFNWVIGVGVIFLLNPDLPEDLTHYWLLVVCLFLFICGALFAASPVFDFDDRSLPSLYSSFWSKSLLPAMPAERSILIGFFVFSIFVSVIYYFLIGYNLAFSVFSSGIDDVTTARLNAYAGENYYAPGVVNQFKNTALPIAFIFLIFQINDVRLRFYFIVLFAPVLFFSLAGTGQRTFIVLFLLQVVLCVAALNRGRLRVELLIVPSVAIGAIFIYISSSLGRFSGGFFDGLGEIFHRIFASNQFAAVHGFRYISQHEIVFGSDWMQSFAGLIPGIPGSNISNLIFADIFGGERGTAPLSVWGSAYYNFGFLGASVFAFILGFLYLLLYRHFLRGDFFHSRLICYCFLFLYLGVWISGAPSQLFNNGVLGVMLVLMCVILVRRNR